MALEPQEIGIEEYNRRITAWGSGLGLAIMSRFRMLTNKGKGDLLKSLRLKIGEWFGEVDLLTYRFARHGVFIHKGVGRGHGLWDGKVMHYRGDLSIQSMKKNPKFKNKKYESNVPAGFVLKRMPIEWFNPVVNDNIKGLADLIAEMDADRLVNATKMLIK